MDSKRSIDPSVILVGRGSLYSRRPGEDLSAHAADVRASRPGVLVVEALLEQGSPSLPSALDTCVRSGAQTVVVLPMFVPLEPAIWNWIQLVARRWLRQTSSPLEIILGEPPSEQLDFVSVVNCAVDRAIESNNSLELTVASGGTSSTDWSVIPLHYYHVLFCQGPRCTAAGAGEIGVYLRRRLSELGLEEDSAQVLAASTGCLYPCNLGPVMVTYPDGTWYCGLDEEAVDRIIQEHFIGGKVVDRYAHQPKAGPQTIYGLAHPYS